MELRLWTTYLGFIYLLLGSVVQNDRETSLARMLICRFLLVVRIAGGVLMFLM